jgi:hypothetical protein
MSKKPTLDLKKIFVEEKPYQDIKAFFSNCRVIYQDNSHGVHTLAVKVDGTIVVNVYNSPSASWSNVPLKLVPHPAIYVGDFNSHNQLWGYKHNSVQSLHQ